MRYSSFSPLLVSASKVKNKLKHLYNPDLKVGATSIVISNDDKTLYVTSAGSLFGMTYNKHYSLPLLVADQ